MFIDDIKEIVCKNCYDSFCQKREKDLLYCISTYKKAYDER